jgi:hypothetical protein
MSQLASFTYLKIEHVSMLGFWSKPKPRLFRSSESKFEDYLNEKQLRHFIFKSADGVYVALVFAWLHSLDSSLMHDPDPVIETVRRNVGGSHWLLMHSSQKSLKLLSIETSTESFTAWRKNMGEKLSWNEHDAFESARKYLIDKIADIALNEALLVSVG